MSDPRYKVALRVPAPPDVVLAAIRHAIANTRRGDLPAHLQRGVRGLAGKVRGGRFTVRLDRTEPDETDLVGRVVPVEGGGSDVRASVLDSHGAPTHALVLLGIAGGLALAGLGELAWIAAGFAALVAIIATFRHATGLIDHDEAAFLVAWLRGVLDPLAAPHPRPPALIDADPVTPTSPS